MWEIDDAIASLNDVVCPNCKEYKGMTEGDDGIRYCVFCE